MARFKLTIEYDGTPYAGWQRQRERPTVQGQLEEVFSDFLKAPTEVWGSGRTDAGVHARGQVAHVNVEKDYSPLEIQGAINQRLRHCPIRVLTVEEVAPDFHARFSALSRSYVYKILNRRAGPSLEENRVWWVIPALSAEKMAEAIPFLLGHHDFSAFRCSHCQASSPFKTLDDLRIEQAGELILVKARARSFLHHQVRNIVGTLKRVGEGSWPPSRVQEILESGDRCQAGPTAPACGLYLSEITYKTPIPGV